MKIVLQNEVFTLPHEFHRESIGNPWNLRNFHGIPHGILDSGILQIPLMPVHIHSMLIPYLFQEWIMTSGINVEYSNGIHVESMEFPRSSPSVTITHPMLTIVSKKKMLTSRIEP